jgi:ATP-dependent RNA helicase SUPV3L1/SUV3
VEKFNNPDDPCNVLVSTDAIGMGLNINIRRIIFNTLVKKNHEKSLEDMNLDEYKSIAPKNSTTRRAKLLHGIHDQEEKQENESNSIDFETKLIDIEEEFNQLNSPQDKNLIPVTQLLQIAGRAGRYGSEYGTGYFTTVNQSEIPTLKRLYSKQPLPQIEKIGILPSLEHLELFSFHLPNQSFHQVFKLFLSICQIDKSQYFLSDSVAAMMLLTKLIDHIPLSIKDRYHFITSPIRVEKSIHLSIFVTFVRYYRNNEPVTHKILQDILKWPLLTAKTVSEQLSLIDKYDIIGLYLWYSFKFPNIFYERELVEEMRDELEAIIEAGAKSLNQVSNKNEKNLKIRNKNINNTRKKTKNNKYPF